MADFATTTELRRFRNIVGGSPCDEHDRPLAGLDQPLHRGGLGRGAALRGRGRQRCGRGRRTRLRQGPVGDR